MNTWNAYRITAALTGAVMAGEAIALLVGMHLLSEPGNPWISAKNDALLALDAVAGLGLAWVGWRAPDAAGSSLSWLLTAVGLLSHAYRDGEYLARAANPFLLNAPLFAINNLKLLGLLIVVITGFGLGSSRWATATQRLWPLDKWSRLCYTSSRIY